MQTQKATIIVLALLLSLIFLSTSLFAQANLLGSWPFNNSGIDASGNGHDATLQGNAIFIDSGAKGSHSLLLDGTNSYASVGEINFGDEFTVCAWVFLETGTTNIQTIFGNAMGGSLIDGFKLFINNWETNNKCILIETSDGATRLDAASPENTFEEGVWNHVAITIDRLNGLSQIYYNGEDVTLNGAVVTGFQVTNPVTIGSMSGPDWFWNGMIDDVRVYDAMLSIDDIVAVMDDPETGISRHPRETVTVDNFNLTNYPNPFNPTTTIAFDVAHTGEISLTIMTVTGQEVCTLVQETKTPGHYTVTWDGRDNFGATAPSGVYLYQLKGENFSQTHKMALAR